MFRNYFKTAWRNLVKNRFYTLLNIGGLAVGLAVGIMILLWVQDEYSFDAFHRNKKNIYKVENMVGTGSSRQLWTETVAPIGTMAKSRIPGVEEVARTSYNGYYALFKYNNKLFNEKNNYFTDPSFFTVFDFKIIQGNAANPFPDKHSIVITERTATKYFDTENPIGKIITAERGEQFTVTGIVKDIPKNSDFSGDIFFSMNLMADKVFTGNRSSKNLDNDFSYYDFNTYLLLKPGMKLDALTGQMRQLHLSMSAEDTDVDYVLMPLEKTHLYRADGSDAGIGTVRIFIVIAVLILAIACVNYVNLSTARAMIRAKEVSLRKIIGAARWQLFMQFIVETALLFVGATFIALMLVSLLTPMFNSVSGKELVVNYTGWNVWKVIGITITGTLIISSIYPALLLSSFKPLKALKGKLSARLSDAMFRKVLVVVQFSFSVILITGTIIVGNQLNYMRARQLSYDKDHVLSMNMINMTGHIESGESGADAATWRGGCYLGQH